MDLIQVINYNYLYWMIGSYVLLWLLLLLYSTINDFTQSGNPLFAILLTWLLAFGLHFFIIIVTVGWWGSELYQSGESVMFIIFNFIFIVACILIDTIIISLLIHHINNVKKVPRTL